MPVGFTSVSASYLQTADGTPIDGALITFQPVSSRTGIPICFRSGGYEGATSFEKLGVIVSKGAFTIELADTTQTSPLNIGYSVTVTDILTGDVLLFYPCIQPYGTTWSLDTYEPAYSPPMATITTGPQGQPGLPGSVTGGTVSQRPVGTIDGTNPKFTVAGVISIPLLFKNGVFQEPTSSFNWVAVGNTTTLTYVPASVPVVGDTHWFVGVTPSGAAPASTGVAPLAAQVIGDSQTSDFYQLQASGASIWFSPVTPAGGTTPPTVLQFNDDDGDVFAISIARGSLQINPSTSATPTPINSLALTDAATGQTVTLQFSGGSYHIS